MIGHAFSRPYQGGEELSPQHLLDCVADVRRGWCEGPVHIRRSARGYLNRTDRHPYLHFLPHELGIKKTPADRRENGCRSCSDVGARGVK